MLVEYEHLMTQAAGRSKRMSAVLVLVLFPMLLTGCLYPDEKLQENKVSYRKVSSGYNRP